MNADSPSFPSNDPEVRLTALLLGELPATEAAALRAELATNPELARLYARLALAIELTRETTRAAHSEVTRPPLASDATRPEPLQLDPARRARLRAAFQTPANRVVPMPMPAPASAAPTDTSSPFTTGAAPAKSRRRSQTRDLLALAAMLVALLTLAGVATRGPRSERFLARDETAANLWMETASAPESGFEFLPPSGSAGAPPPPKPTSDAAPTLFRRALARPPGAEADSNAPQEKNRLRGEAKDRFVAEVENGPQSGPGAPALARRSGLRPAQAPQAPASEAPVNGVAQAEEKARLGLQNAREPVAQSEPIDLAKRLMTDDFRPADPGRPPALSDLSAAAASPGNRGSASAAGKPAGGGRPSARFGGWTADGRGGLGGGLGGFGGGGGTGPVAGAQVAAFDVAPADTEVTVENLTGLAHRGAVTASTPSAPAPGGTPPGQPDFGNVQSLDESVRTEPEAFAKKEAKAGTLNWALKPAKPTDSAGLGGAVAPADGYGIAHFGRIDAKGDRLEDLDRLRGEDRTANLPRLAQRTDDLALGTEFTRPAGATREFYYSLETPPGGAPPAATPPAETATPRTRGLSAYFNGRVDPVAAVESKGGDAAGRPVLNQLDDTGTLAGVKLQVAEAENRKEITDSSAPADFKLLARQDRQDAPSTDQPISLDTLPPVLATAATTAASPAANELRSKVLSEPTDTVLAFRTQELARDKFQERELKESVQKAKLTALYAAPTDGRQEEDSLKQRPAPRPAAPVPQPEVVTAADPFSTFSLNVSAVSFQLAAASLEKGALPDPATIRSEEFLNAFQYGDPEPRGQAALGFAWERARTPFAQDREVLRFSVKTAASGRTAGQPLNLVLLVDNSGSMERADRVRIRSECLRVLASQLGPQDRLSILSFARTARLWADGVAGNEAGELVGKLAALTPEGGTNLEDALALAYQTATRHFQAQGINRVVLLTDGAANLGDVTPETLRQTVIRERTRGIALDCFGIGWDGLDDDLLEQLSRNGDGRYGFLNTPEDAATGFAQQLAGALRVAASDVKVQVEFNPRRVTLHRQVGYARHQLKKEQFRDNTVDAAELGAAEAGTALYVVQTNPAGDGPIATVRARFKVPGTATYEEQEWTVPYAGPARALAQAAPSLRLAAVAGAFSEWLAGSPFATEVTPQALLPLLEGVAAARPQDARLPLLGQMLQQAHSLAPK
jgi:Mg-chelatase subunit ChlD